VHECHSVDVATSFLRREVVLRHIEARACIQENEELTGQTHSASDAEDNTT
jgi:hypothetical protein